MQPRLLNKPYRPIALDPRHHRSERGRSKAATPLKIENIKYFADADGDRLNVDDIYEKRITNVRQNSFRRSSSELKHYTTRSLRENTARQRSIEILELSTRSCKKKKKAIVDYE